MNEAMLKQALASFQTPFYLFDTDEAAETVRKLKSALGGRAEICYAVKANPFLALPLRETADAFEACSPGEFRICRRAGIPTEKLVLSGVYKNRDDVYAALELCGTGLLCTVESPEQWHLFADWAAAHGKPVRVLLRLTAGNQFGMDEETLRGLLEEREKTLLRVEGIQFFSGTQKHSPGHAAKELERLDDLLDGLKLECGYTAERLEYGPGLPVDYFSGDAETELPQTQALAEQLGKLRFRGKLVLEMGRRIAARCGSYCVTGVDLKQSGGTRWGITDGGIHQLGYYGQMLGMKHPQLLHPEETGGEKIPWTVCGALCTANDVLVRDCLLAGLRTGDRLIFGKAGAYSMTESPALFLSRDLPEIVLYSEKDGLRSARHRYQTDRLNAGSGKDQDQYGTASLNSEGNQSGQ